MPIPSVDADASRLTRPVGPVAAVARAAATRDATDAARARPQGDDTQGSAVPNLGPYRIGSGGGFQLVVYSEPLLRTGLQPAIADRGRVFDERA